MGQLTNYLKSDEKQNLIRFNMDVRSEFLNGSLGIFGSIGNWDDLFDIIPTHKKQKLVGWINYFLLDYEDEEIFNELKEIVKDKGAFFFPDFITENFTFEEFYSALKSWMDTINLSFSESELKELRKKLQMQKKLSNELIFNISEKKSTNSINVKGFESVSILYIINKKKQDIIQSSPYLQK